MAGPQSHAFTPQVSKVLAATGTTARTILDFTGCLPPYQVRIVAAGTDNSYIEFGDVTVVAVATTSLLMLNGTTEVFNLPAGTTYIAALASSTTSSVHITTGNGM